MSEQEFDTRSSSVVSIDGKTIQTSIEITRRPNEAPDDTYFGAAKQIQNLDVEECFRRKHICGIIAKYIGHEVDNFLARMGRYCKIEFNRLEFTDLGEDLGMAPADETDSTDESKIWGVANVLSKLDPKAEGFVHDAEARLKKLSHYFKLRVAKQIQAQHSEGMSEFGKEIINGKIETHQSFSSAPLDEQIYGRGNWLPEVHHCACGAVANCSEYKNGVFRRHCSQCA